MIPEALRPAISSAALVVWMASAAPCQNATEIIRKVDQNLRGSSSYAEITMTIVKPEWSRTMSLKAWGLGEDYGLVLVTAPARDKGTVTLKRDTEVWNWIPSIERIIKIPPSMMMQSWLGSDFTNDDLVRESSVVNDYTHTLSGDSTIDGSPCYRITMIPKENAPVVWGKVITYVSKEYFVQLRSEMYDEEGVLSKILATSNLRTLAGRTLPSRWVMQPADAPGQRTVMEYGTWQFEIALDESFFSLQNMRKVR